MKWGCVASALAIVLAVSAAQAGKTDDAAGAAALKSYTLSMDKVKRYAAAMDAMQGAGKADSSLKAEGDKMSNEPDRTLADVEAKFAHHPRLFAFFAKQGLSTHDAATLPIALMDACTVVQMPQIGPKMADRVSDSQIAFCKLHLAELKTMKFFSGEEQ